MKPVLIYSFVFAVFSPVFIFGQVSSYLSSSSCGNYNKFLNNGQMEQVNALVASSLPNGTLYLNPDKAENLDAIFQAMGVPSGTTFQLEKETKSRFDENKVFRKYQQYYNGVKVEGGGHTTAYIIPGTPTDPCGPVAYMMTPHILTDMSLNTNPTIPNTAISGVLNTLQVHSSELVITHNLTNQCEYTLAWKTLYDRGGARISWINAQTGSIIKTVDARMEHNAPTATYGNQFLNDLTLGNQTSLRSPDGRVITYNFGFTCPNGILNTAQWTNGLVPTTTNPTTWTNESTDETYQAFWVTSQVLPLFDGIGINFGTVNVAECGDFTAFSANGSTMANAFIALGNIDGSTTAIFDVIAHELGHTYLNQFLEYTDVFNNATLHEGISDIIGTYIESLVPNNMGVDWVMGDDEPNVANCTCVDRDLQNPRFDCVTETPNEQHERGIPLGHWYFLISQGSAANNIPALGMNTALNILLESLPALETNSGYEDLMNATLTTVLEEFGRCSNEFLAVARAWELICVPTGFALPSGVIPACNYVLTGPNSVCEESNYLEICVNGGLPGAYYRWNIIGKKSTEFTSLGGMQGNSQEGGTCLTLIQFPTYPYYPQYITIQVYSPTVGSQYIQKKRIKIIDCDGDDPTCEEYYELQGDNPEERESPDYIETVTVHRDESHQQVKVFDIVGKLIYEGASEGFNTRILSYNGLAILVYYKESGEIVKAKKVLLTNR